MRSMVNSISEKIHRKGSLSGSESRSTDGKLASSNLCNTQKQSFPIVSSLYLLSIQNMSLKVGTLDNNQSELESSLVKDMDWLFRWNSILPPDNVTISKHFYRTHIKPVLADYDEALSRRRQHCKTVNELNERLSRENERLKKILSDNWINQYIS